MYCSNSCVQSGFKLKSMKFQNKNQSKIRDSSGQNSYMCMFDLMLFIPVNNYSHVGTLPPFYGTSFQHRDIMISKM